MYGCEEHNTVRSRTSFGRDVVGSTLWDLPETGHGFGAPINDSEGRQGRKERGWRWSVPPRWTGGGAVDKVLSERVECNDYVRESQLDLLPNFAGRPVLKPDVGLQAVRSGRIPSL